MRSRLAVVFAVFISGWLWLDARAQSGGPLVSGAHRFEKIANGIYYATASGTMQVGANSPVIESDGEAIIIDSGTSPAAGRALDRDDPGQYDQRAQRQPGERAQLLEPARLPVGNRQCGRGQ